MRSIIKYLSAPVLAALVFVLGDPSAGRHGSHWALAQNINGSTQLRFVAPPVSYSPVFTGTSATGAWQGAVGPGSAFQVLTSNGAGALPSWQPAGAGSTTIGGSVGSPSIPLVGDTTTGIYKSTAAQIAFSISGVGRGVFSSTGLGITGAISTTVPIEPATQLNLTGAPVAYSPVFAGVTSTGAWQATIGTGTAAQVLTSNGAGALPSWQTPSAGSASISGTVGAPSIAVSGDATSGIFKVAAGAIGYAISGVQTGVWTSTGLGVSGALSATSPSSFAAGTVSAPGIYLGTDTGTGWYRTTTAGQSFATNGVKLLDLVSTGPTITMAGTGKVVTVARTGMNGLGAALGLSVQTDAKTASDSTGISMLMLDSASAQLTYGSMSANIVSPTAGARTGSIIFNVPTAGSTADVFTIAGGTSILTSLLHINNGGSVSAPTLYLAGDTSTGIYRSAANEMAFTVSGTQRVAVRSSGINVTGLVNPTSGYSMNSWTIDSGTAPTVNSGFCTSPSIASATGTAGFSLTIGTSCTGVTSGILTMPAAGHQWMCTFANVTNPGANAPTMTANTTTSVTITNYARTTGIASDFTAGDSIRGMCRAF